MRKGFRDDPQHGVGAIQDWVWSGRNHTSCTETKYPADLPRCAFFDYLIENSDRHKGNFFITDGGKIQLIDHDLSFNTGTKRDVRTGNAVLVQHALHKTIPRDLMQRAVDTVMSVTEGFRRLGMEEKAIQRYQERVELVRKRLETGSPIDVDMLVSDYLRRE